MRGDAGAKYSNRSSFAFPLESGPIDLFGGDVAGQYISELRRLIRRYVHVSIKLIASASSGSLPCCH